MCLSGYGGQGLIPLHRGGGALAAPQGTGLALPTATGAPGVPQSWARLMRCGRGSLVWDGGQKGLVVLAGARPSLCTTVPVLPCICLF